MAKFGAFLLLTTLFAKSEAEELFVMRRTMSNSTTELQCFYNGPQDSSAGLSWVLPPSVSALSESHQRWKHKSDSGFVKGHFEYYGHIWESKNSLEVPAQNLLPPVFDERWNDFPRIDTAAKSGQFQLLSPYSTDRFHLSVLAKSDAQVALHIGSDPHTSLSYLITLDPQGSPGVTLELCPVGVRREEHKKEEHKCTLLAKNSEVFGSSVLKNGKEWVHLTIRLEHNVQMTHHIVVSDASKDGKTLLDHRKHVLYHKAPSFVSVRTTEDNGSWRIHKYRVVVHNGKEDGEGFNVMQVTKSTSSCLQIYYYFRRGFGKTVAKTKNGDHSIELEPTDGKWKFAIIRLPMAPPQDHVHFLPPFGDHLQYTGPVFALFQPFRVCGEQEFFTTKVLIPADQNATNAVCQNVQSGAYATFKDSKDVPPSKISCPSGTFSKFCNITCGHVVGDLTCQGKVMCDQDACTCLPGYNSGANGTCSQELGPRDNSSVKPTSAEDVVGVSEDEEEEEVNLDSGEDYYVELDPEAAAEGSKRGIGVWWIVTLVVSWCIAFASLFLVIKERPDLVPMCILNPFMRCTGQHRGGDQLINEN